MKYIIYEVITGQKLYFTFKKPNITSNVLTIWEINIQFPDHVTAYPETNVIRMNNILYDTANTVINYNGEICMIYNIENEIILEPLHIVNQKQIYII